MSAPRRKKPVDPLKTVINPRSRGDFLAISAGLLGAVGVVVYGYYSSKRRLKRLSENDDPYVQARKILEGEDEDG